jgi:hypothetical protein
MTSRRGEGGGIPGNALYLRAKRMPGSDGQALLQTEDDGKEETRR